MMVKKVFFPVLVVLVGLSGCMGNKKKPAADQKKKRAATASQVDIPLAGDIVRLDDDEAVRSFFDQDMEEFVSLAQEESDDTLSLAQAVDAEAKDTSKAGRMDDFSWIEASDKDEQFGVVYFDFNDHSVRQDQEERVIQDIEQTKKVFTDVASNQPTIVIEGHACHSAGSAVYNLALSEKRAKAVADWFVSAGVSQENIKIVGRGFEVPVLVDGKAVEGGREEQWANRRVEVHAIYS